MAKVTLANGAVVEGTAEELMQMANVFGVPVFEIGDHVRPTSEGNYGGVDVGTVGKITKGPDVDGEYRVDLLDDSDHDYFKPEQLVKITEGYSEPKPDRLKVGDYAKVIKESFGLARLNDIFEITDLNYVGSMTYPYQGTRVIDGRIDQFFKGELVRATDEEVAEAKRKLDEKAEAEKWAKIGRKPNEFIVGDIVRVISRENGGTVKVGELAVIESVSDYDVHLDTFDKRSATYYTFEEVELIAPVEARFDR